MRPTDFLEVTELVSGDLGPEAPCPDSGSDWLPDAGVGDASGGMNARGGRGSAGFRRPCIGGQVGMKVRFSRRHRVLRMLRV